MSMLPEGVYQRAITHDDASAFRARMKQYKERLDDQRREAAKERVRAQFVRIDQRKRA